MIFLYNKNSSYFNFDILKQRLIKYPTVTCHFIEISTKESYTLPNVDLLVTNSYEASHVRYFLDKFPNLKWIHSLFAGVDKFLLNSGVTERNDVILTNAKGAYSDPLAEFCILSMLYFNYHIPNYNASFDKKEWYTPVNEMINKKSICIIGYGQNGIALAKRIKSAFNMTVYGIVRLMRDNIEGKEYCEKLFAFEHMNEIIGQCDFIVATLPQTPMSNRLFGKDFFGKLKTTCVFINIGRGSAVIEEDLINALDKGIIRAAALDVTQVEPLPKDSPLYLVPKEKLLLTCHSADMTTSYDDQCFDVLEENLVAYINTGTPKTIVNKNEGY